VVQNSNIRSRNEQSARVRKRAEARRLEILRGAARVFRKRGFAAAGMREIAREIDLSPGNLYHYFKSKDEILFFCQDRSLDVMLAALQSARLSGRSPAEQLGSALRAHVHCLLDELEGAVAHLEVEALPDELRAPIIQKRDRYERGIRRMVSAGVRQGAFAPCDARLITRAMLGAVNWSARWFRPEGPRSAASVADALADYLIGGLVDDRKRAVEPEVRDG
jgi:AcrR family transcriptional regulator